VNSIENHADKTATSVQQAYDQARSLLAEKNFADADAACVLIEQLEPDYAGAIFLRGVIALETKRPEQALKFLERAITLNPNNANYFAQLAKVQVELRNIDKARSAAEQGAALKSKDGLTLDTLGVVLSHLGEHSRAADMFQAAANLHPRNTNFLYNLGCSLKFAGQFDAAESALDKALAIKPDLHNAHFALSYLKRQTQKQNHVEGLESAINTYSGKPAGRLQLGYALAKEHDDLEQYEQAWQTLATTNAIWNRSSGYQSYVDERLVKQLIETFSLNDNPADNGNDSKEPIFIVGMPRTGTTLTERILSSHSAVFSAGELPNMGLLAKKLAGSASQALLDPRLVRKSARILPSELGSAYIESTRPATSHTPHFIDKLPHNFLYIGLILRALPNAKVICLHRNPMDTCLGNFRQLFAPGHPFFAYSYDILNCGRYYLQFDQLMKHWQTVFPGRILEIKYEDIVENQKQKTHELLDYCGLPWEDQCMEFEKNTAPVATASSAQVREPLNRKGLNRWKKYEQELQPLVDFFHDHNIEVDT
jgi:Tfp pilus assembly protein PilF